MLCRRTAADNAAPRKSLIRCNPRGLLRPVLGTLVPDAYTAEHGGIWVVTGTGWPGCSTQRTMYDIDYAAGVAEDLAGLRAFDLARILDEIEQQLTQQPTQETRNKKLLPGLKPPWDQELPVWELRAGEYRVFYDVDDAERLVTVRAIRRKPPHATTEEIL